MRVENELNNYLNGNESFDNLIDFPKNYENFDKINSSSLKHKDTSEDFENQEESSGIKTSNTTKFNKNNVSFGSLILLVIVKMLII